MTYIKSLEVSGLNGRHDSLQFNFNRGTNVLFGPNGCGKTSVLRILDSALSGDIEKISNVNFSSASVIIHSEDFDCDFLLSHDKSQKHHDRQNASDNLYVKAASRNSAPARVIAKSDYISNYSEHDALGYVKEIISWKTKPLMPISQKPKGAWAHMFLSTNRLYSFDGPFIFSQTSHLSDSTAHHFQIGDFSPPSEVQLERIFTDAVQSIWGYQFAKMTQKINQIQDDGLQNILAEVLTPEGDSHQEDHSQPITLIDAGQAYDRMARFLSRQSGASLGQSLGKRDGFIERYKNEPHLQRIVRHVDDVERRIDEVNSPTKALSSLIFEMFLSNKEVNFDRPEITVKTKDGENIGIGRLSSGEKHIIKILLSAIQAGVSSLIIDEPELSMHIDWQSTLLEKIHVINPSCQIICATHSPEIMSNIPDEEIFPL